MSPVPTAAYTALLWIWIITGVLSLVLQTTLLATPWPLAAIVSVHAALAIWEHRERKRDVERVRAEQGDLAALKFKADVAETRHKDSQVRAICAVIETEFGADEAEPVRHEMAQRKARRWSPWSPLAVTVYVSWMLLVATAVWFFNRS